MADRGQQQADALVQLADNALAAGNLPFLRTVKPHVVVTIDHEDLMDPHTGHGAARTGFGTLVSAARARMLACDGGIVRIVFGPKGRPLDLGRDKRLSPPPHTHTHTRRALDVRDKGCVFAGCHAPTWWCDAHHLVHWVDRRRDIGGQRRPALRAAPHRGPPRLPGRTTTRRPMAHLPPRRQ